MVPLLDCQDCYCVRPLDCVLDLGEGEQEATSFTPLSLPFQELDFRHSLAENAGAAVVCGVGEPR